MPRPVNGERTTTVTATIDLEVRRASARDIYALATDTETKGLLTERLRRTATGRRGELLIACRQERPIGHIYLWEEPADEPEIRERLPSAPLIMNLWVQPDLRRRGIGTHLMHIAENRLWNRGHRTVALGVDTENKDAVRLYQNLDYSRWAHPDIETHRDHFLPDGQHLVTRETCTVYVKRLDAGAR